MSLLLTLFTLSPSVAFPELRALHDAEGTGQSQGQWAVCFLSEEARLRTSTELVIHPEVSPFTPPISVPSTHMLGAWEKSKGY